MTALWTQDALTAATGGSFVASGFAAEGVAIDSRKITPGEVFVALADARDGHDFVADALANGAAGAIVNRLPEGVETAKLLLVDDTQAALEALGRYGRGRSDARVVAITGSVGKSTTKEMLRRALGAFGTVHGAEASFNNHIGVPLTLARLPREAAFCVVEIGMNHPGEIAPLARMAAPHAAIVTAVAAAHIGLMGSLEAIADEKAEIARGLQAGGAAILPRGPFLSHLAHRVPDGALTITFGAQTMAEARLIAAESDAGGVDVTADILRHVVRFRLAAPGLHMAMNAVASLAAVAALGLDVAQAAAALDGFAPLAGRGARRSLPFRGGEITLLDESYNASGASMRAAFDVLALLPGRRVAVLGDMLELGEHAEDEHAALADPLAEVADLVFACGPHMRALFDALPAAKRGGWAAESEALADQVAARLAPGDSVLVKGSLGSRMRAVVAAIEAAR